MSGQWIRAVFYLMLLFSVQYLAPAIPVDPWGLFSLKKISAMIFALAAIHFLGVFFIRYFGTKLGVLLSGFLGGLVSSTALTATLAKKSAEKPLDGIEFQTISFLTATLAMLTECVVLIAVGCKEQHLELYLIFIAPALVTLAFIIKGYIKAPDRHEEFSESAPFEIRAVLKLTVFIVGILALSKILQNMFGHQGLMVLTFLVSLFEIHSSVIANIQLFENESLNLSTLLILLQLSVTASYISKIFLIHSLGSPPLKKMLTKLTLYILASFILAWFVIFLFFKF